MEGVPSGPYHVGQPKNDFQHLQRRGKKGRAGEGAGEDGCRQVGSKLGFWLTARAC